MNQSYAGINTLIAFRNQLQLYNNILGLDKKGNDLDQQQLQQQH